MDKNYSVRGKRFLITQPMIGGFNGSTMVTLELAEYLVAGGAKVVVYTNVARRPALEAFDEAGIQVVMPHEDALSMYDFDYIWVHSLTMPQSILDELKSCSGKMPTWIFLHMSPLESIPDEHPWIYNLENTLSSMSLYISEKTLESNEKYGLPSRVALFRNPAPPEFKVIARRNVSRKLRKILIVSSHPPKEVLRARDNLREAGVKVDWCGEWRGWRVRLDPTIIGEYDAVLTIGKTVQYAIVGALPVYIYDWYGGPGWLNDANYEQAKINNFSGRSFGKKSGDEITREILRGYNEALEYHLKFSEKKKSEFLLNVVLSDVLRRAKPRKIHPIDGAYIESVKSAVACAEIRFVASEDLSITCECLDVMTKKYEDCRRQLKELRSRRSYRFINTCRATWDRVKRLFWGAR